MFRSDNLFSRFMNVLFDIICIGVLWVVCSIPLVTLGAAATAAYYAIAKSVRYKTGYGYREFFHSFKENFRQTASLSVIFLFLFLILGVDIYYVWINDNRVNSGIFMVLLFILFLVSGIVLYACPLLSRFEKRNLELIKMAGVVMFRYLPITVICLSVFGAVVTGIYLMPWAVFILPGVYLYIFSFPMERILRKLMPAAEEGSEEAGKWYYQ